MCTKASFDIQILRGVVKYLSLDSAKTVVCALVLSHIDYANSIYIGLPSTAIKLLQHMQKLCGQGCAEQEKV